MSLLTADATVVVGIDKESLVVWGEDSDNHFGFKEKGNKYTCLKTKEKDGAPYYQIKLKWKEVIYKPKVVASRGAFTAVVGAAPKIVGKLRNTIFRWRKS